VARDQALRDERRGERRIDRVEHVEGRRMPRRGAQILGEVVGALEYRRRDAGARELQCDDHADRAGAGDQHAGIRGRGTGHCGMFQCL
jgi:hypothetical protein